MILWKSLESCPQEVPAHFLRRDSHPSAVTFSVRASRPWPRIQADIPIEQRGDEEVKYAEVVTGERGRRGGEDAGPVESWVVDVNDGC